MRSKTAGNGRDQLPKPAKFKIDPTCLAQASVKTGSEIISVEVAAYQHRSLNHEDNQEGNIEENALYETIADKMHK